MSNADPYDRPIPPGFTAAPPIDEEAVRLFELVIGGATDDDEQHELTEEETAAIDRFSRFEIHDDGAAEWAMRHMRRLERRKREVVEQAAEWRAPIDAWEARALARLLPSRTRFAAALEAYAVERRQADPDTATIELPSGDLATTKSKPKVEVTDDAALALWLNEALQEVPEELCTWTPKVYVVPLRKLLAIAEEEVEVGTDEETGDPVTELRRYAVSPIDPATGEPWDDETPLAARAAPGTAVADPAITVKIKPSR